MAAAALQARGGVAFQQVTDFHSRRPPLTRDRGARYGPVQAPEEPTSTAPGWTPSRTLTPPKAIACILTGKRRGRIHASTRVGLSDLTAAQGHIAPFGRPPIVQKESTPESVGRTSRQRIRAAVHRRCRTDHLLPSPAGC